MPLFPRRFNNNFNQNIPYYYPNGAFQYNNPYNQNYEQYSYAIDEMIKRNIQAENFNKDNLSELSEQKKSEISKKLGDFIINERNSFLFYEYLRGICPNQNCRVILKKISEDCSFSQTVYSEFYKKCFEDEFCVKKSNIDESIGFFDGLLWAIEEESNSIISISDFIRFMEGKASEINIIIQRKTARLGYLFYILNCFKKADFKDILFCGYQ